MRTKTLLLAAALIAAGIGASQAQVYSVNAVGYINVVCPPGYKIVANQLAGTNYTVGYLLPSLPEGTTLLKWVGNGYLINSVDGGEWLDPEMTLAPGEASFVFNPTATNLTLTFVGDVLQGNLTNTVPQLYSMQSSKVPQAGLLQSQLGYVPTAGDQVYRYSNGYLIYTYDGTEWDEEPLVNVGEGFFILRNAAGTGLWTRAFSVN